MKYYFSNKFIADKKTTGYDIALKGYLDTYGNYLPDHLIESKTCMLNIQSKNSTKTNESIIKLINNGDINGIIKGDSLYQIRKTNIAVPPFTIFDSEDIDKIINTTYTFKYSMLKHFCLILTNRFYNKSYNASYVCDRSLNYFSELEDISIRVLMKYNTILEKIGVLYIQRSINPHKTNLYSLPNDKKYAINYAEYTGRNSESLDANKKRSLMQKYYRLYVEREKCGYTKAELEEIRDYIEVFNKLAKPENRRDMSVFDTIQI